MKKFVNTRKIEMKQEITLHFKNEHFPIFKSDYVRMFIL